METLWLVFSIILVLAGFVGTFLPILPGLPLLYGGILLWGIAGHWQDYSLNTAIVLGVITVLVTTLDYWAGVVGAKKYGASGAGIWGAIIGGILGVIFFNVAGLIAGPLLGAVAGELLSGKSQRHAWRAGWGTFVGFLTGSFIRIVTGIIMTGLFFYYLIS